MINSWNRRAQLRALLPHFIAWAGIWMALAWVQGYDYDYDILNYHFYNGFAFLHGKTFSNVQPATGQSYFQPLTDAVFYVLVRHLPPTVVIMAIAFFQSLAFPILFCTSRRLFADRLSERNAFWISLVLTILGAAAPISVWEAGSHRGTTDSVPFVLVALLLVVDALQKPAASPIMKIVAAGALTGLAAGLKLTNAPFVIGLWVALAAPLLASESKARAAGTVRALVAYAVGSAASFLLVYGWWGALLYIHLGNPFFPNFNQIFHSPFGASLSYSDLWLAAFAPPTWRDTLLFPFVRSSLVGPLNSAGLFDLRMGCALPLIILALTVLLFRRMRRSDRIAVSAADLAVLLFVLVSYACWLLVFPVNRYLVAVDIVAPLATVLAIGMLWRSRMPLAIGTLALCICLPLSAYRTLPLWWIPGAHRHGDEGGYFGVRFAPPPDLDHAVVAMLSEQPTAFVIPFFPRTTTFVRVQGWLLLPLGPFYNLSTPKGRAGAFANAMSKAICQRLDAAGDKLFLLHVRPADTPRDVAAMTYFGLADSGGTCTRIENKSGMDIELCPAKRKPRPECASA